MVNLFIVWGLEKFVGMGYIRLFDIDLGLCYYNLI